MQPKNFFMYAGSVFLLAALFLVLSGCNSNEGLSDDSTKEAKIERGLMALDEPNYSEAERIFKELIKDYPSDNRILAYLSNAIAGGAGFDTFNLLETIDKMDDKGGTDGKTIELIGKTLTGSSDQPELTEAEVEEKIKKFEEALDALLKISGNSYLTLTNRNPDARTIQADEDTGIIKDSDYLKFTDDELVQLGLLGINHTIIMLCNAILDDLKAKIPGFEEKITLTEEWIKDKYSQNPAFDLSEINGVDVDDFIKKINLDIEIINKAIKAIANFIEDEDNDLQEEFNEFLKDIDKDLSGKIDEDELNNYINNL